MGEITATWKGAYGGLPRAGSATLLAPLVAEHGIAVVVAHLGRYCAETSSQFASVRRFVETFGAWGGRVELSPDEYDAPDFAGGTLDDVDQWLATHRRVA